MEGIAPPAGSLDRNLHCYVKGLPNRQETGPSPPAWAIPWSDVAMTTDIEQEELVQETKATIEEQPVALEELLEFMRERVHGDMTRCPVCDLLVSISARRCQHCESNIEANNALVRETLRHIDEMAGRLDEDGWALDRTWRSIKNRIKRMFGRTVTIKGIVSDNDTQRTLTGVQSGDQITVVATHGAWTLVRTTDGSEGWVYSLSKEK